VFFTHVCRVAAILVLVGGVLQIGMGITIASGVLGSPQDALQRYSGAMTTGAMIDRGNYAVLFAVAVGALAEIGFSIRKLR
jgi:hypothetical protein